MKELESKEVPRSELPRWMGLALILSLTGCGKAPDAPTPSSPTPAKPAAETNMAAPAAGELGKWVEYTKQANELAASDKLVDAVAVYREAIKLKPDYVTALVNLGSTLIRLDRSEEAIPHLRAALASDPEQAAANLNLATILVATGQSKEALPLLQRALKTQPDVPEVHRHLGQALFELGDFAGAVTHYQRLTELKPQEATAVMNLGMAQARSGAAAEGLANLKRAAEMPNAPTDVVSILSWTLASSTDPTVRDVDKALSLAKEAVAKANDELLPAALRTQANAEAAKGDFDAAKITIIRAADLAKKRGDEEAYQRLVLDQFEFEAGRTLRQ